LTVRIPLWGSPSTRPLGRSAREPVRGWLTAGQASASGVLSAAGSAGASGASVVPLEGSGAASEGDLSGVPVTGVSGVAAAPAAATPVVAAGVASWGLAPAAAPGAPGAGRRRMEKRVTAKTKARAKAARPTREAPTTDAPSGRAVSSATWRPFTVLGAPGEVADGWSVGNRFPALPPGLSVGLRVEVTPGRSPTDSGEVVVIGATVELGATDELGEVDGLGDVDGVTVPEIATVADDDGFAVRLSEVPVTVTLTDFTDDAVVATVVCA
jgi:hypothetical protein